jgi:hypothetical protein
VTKRALLVPDHGLYLAFRLPIILREAGYRVDALCQVGDSIRSSRYLDRVTCVPSIKDQILHLHESMAKGLSRGKLIVVNEAVVRSLARDPHKDWIREWQPGLADPIVQNLLRDKGGLIDAAEAWGLPIPETRVCHSRDDLAAFASERKEMLILKPMDGSGGAGVSLLPVGAEAPRETAFPLLAQKFIDGQMGVVEMFCTRGEVKGWLASETLVKTNCRFGPSTARRFRYEADLAPLVQRLARKTLFEGFCGFDWIREKHTEKPYVIEFHPRAPSGFRFGRACGVSFAKIIAEWDDRDSNSAVQTQSPGSSVEAYYFTGDLLRCMRHRDWKGLRKWLPGPNRYHDYYWDDPALFITQFRQLLGRPR